MKKKVILSILLLSFVFSGYSQWSKGKGKGYYKLSTWYLKTDKHFTNSGTTESNIERTYFNISAYAEYGISSKIDLITYVPIYAKNTTKDESLSSVGDINIGANYSFYKKNNWAASAKIIFGLPTGISAGGSDESYQTGDGEFNQYIAAALGYSTALNGLPVYAKSYLGYNNRSKGYSDEFKFGIESGINLFQNKLWAIARINIVKPINNGTIGVLNTIQGSIFASNVEYTSFGFEAAYLITKKIGVSFGYDSAFSGKIIAANPSLSAGVFMNIK